MYELQGYTELQTDDAGYFGDDEDDGCKKEETVPLQRSSSLQRELSINASAASLKQAEYKSLDDIVNYLHLRDVTFNALYNNDDGFLQISLTRIRLFPLPAAIAEKFTLQYKLFFLIPDSISCESSPKPLRHQIHFDEKYRMHHSWDDVKDAEMRLNIYVLDTYFNTKVLPTVRYVLKPVTTADNEFYGEAASSDIKIECIRQENGHQELPRVLVSLCYKPTSGRIHLRLIKGENFPATAHDMKLRAAMLRTRYGSVRSFTTPVMQNCRNPYIDEEASFGISVPHIQTAEIVITLLYGADMMSFAPIAATKIGDLAPSESGKRHWNDMLKSVRTDVEMWHQLYSE